MLLLKKISLVELKLTLSNQSLYNYDIMKFIPKTFTSAGLLQLLLIARKFFLFIINKRFKLIVFL
jgi:hypothetical protein